MYNHPACQNMTGEEFLTGEEKWFRFQKESFLRVEETAVARMMGSRPRILFNAAIVER
jgi:hypothetical protein